MIEYHAIMDSYLTTLVLVVQISDEIKKALLVLVDPVYMQSTREPIGPFQRPNYLGTPYSWIGVIITVVSRVKRELVVVEAVGQRGAD